MQLCRRSQGMESIVYEKGESYVKFKVYSRGVSPYSLGQVSAFVGHLAPYKNRGT